MRTDAADAALRRFSKEMLSRTYRLETAAAIGRLRITKVHATLVHEHLDGRVPFNKISAELQDFASAGLLDRVSDGSRHAVYDVATTKFFEMAAVLEEEIRQRKS